MCEAFRGIDEHNINKAKMAGKKGKLQLKETGSKETPKQRDSFLIYFNLGSDRSIANVRKEYGKNGVKTSISTLESWCKKYKWVERVKAMDEEVDRKTEEEAIKKAYIKKSTILKAIKNTIIKYNAALLGDAVIPSASDFKKVWEIWRKETGQDLPESPLIKVEINQRILNIVAKAEEDAKQIIEGEIISSE